MKKNDIDLINKQLRKYAKLRFHNQVISTLKETCLKKAMEEIKEGKWNSIKQFKLNGVLYVCEHSKPKDLTLSILSWLTYQNELDIDFKLIPKDRDDIVFTDRGVETVGK